MAQLNVSINAYYSTKHVNCIFEFLSCIMCAFAVIIPLGLLFIVNTNKNEFHTRLNQIMFIKCLVAQTKIQGLPDRLLIEKWGEYHYK